MLVLQILTLQVWKNILQIPGNQICTDPSPSSAGVSNLKKLEVDRNLAFHPNVVVSFQEVLESVLAQVVCGF